MKKLKNFNKTLNYKILSALPVIGVCLATTSQTSSAMFKNSLKFFKHLESSSGASSYITKPLTLLHQKMEDLLYYLEALNYLFKLLLI